MCVLDKKIIVISTATDLLNLLLFLLLVPSDYKDFQGVKRNLFYILFTKYKSHSGKGVNSERQRTVLKSCITLRNVVLELTDLTINPRAQKHLLGTLVIYKAYTDT